MKKSIPIILIFALLSGCDRGEEAAYTAPEPIVPAAQIQVKNETPKEGYYAAEGGGYRWVESGDEPFSDANLASRNGNICEIYYYSEDNFLRMEKFRLSESGSAQPVQCLDFDGVKVWAASENGGSPYDAEKNKYYTDGGEEEIPDIAAFLAQYGTELSNGMLVRDTSPETLTPLYSESNIFIRENSGVMYSRDNSKREAYSYIYLVDADKNALTADFESILPLNERYHLYICEKDGEYSMISVKDGKPETVLSGSKTAYRCIDLGKTAFVFPIGTAGDYYDLDGKRIDDLTAMLKENGRDMRRDEWADKAVKFALDMGYLPPDMAFDYKNDITLREYCALSVSALKNAHFPLKTAYSSPFENVDDYNVSAAYALGLIDGGDFDPNKKISMTEAEDLLTRLSDLNTDFEKADIKGEKGENLTRQQAITAVYDIIF